MNEALMLQILGLMHQIASSSCKKCAAGKRPNRVMGSHFYHEVGEGDDRGYKQCEATDIYEADFVYKLVDEAY